MIAGLRIIGDSGTVQIDSSFSTPNLVKTGLISPRLVPIDNNSPEAPFVDSISSTSMLFIGNTNGAYVAVTASPISSGRFRYSFFSDIPTTVRYYIYDSNPIMQSSSNYGLQIFKENGDLYYDSNGSLLIISKILSTPEEFQSPILEENPMALLSAQGYAAIQNSPNLVSIATRGLRISDSSVQVGVFFLTNPVLPFGRTKPLRATQLVVSKRPNVL